MGTPWLRGPVSGAECATCPFSKEGQPHRPVRGEGPPNPAFLVVGEGPGSNEVISGRPFVGESGRLLNKALAVISRPRQEVYITNATLCILPGASAAKKSKARECCAPRLKKELENFPDLPVLTLGGIAAQSLLEEPDFKITERQGAAHVSYLAGDRYVIPAIHPAAILRGGAGLAGAHAPDLTFWTVCYDAGKVNALANGDPVVFGEELGVDYDHEWEDTQRADELIEYIVYLAREAKFCAVDVETYVDRDPDDPERWDARRPLDVKLRAIGISTPEFAVSVHWKVVTDYAFELIRDLLADPEIVKSFHNKPYDCPVLDRHGMPVRGRREDTLLGHHSAFPGLGHKLQQVASQFFVISAWKAEFRDGEDTPEDLTRYNAKDTLATARLRRPLQVAMEKKDALRTYEIDLVMADIAEMMYVRGVPVSREINEELYQQFSKAVQRARKVIRDAVYSPEILPKVWECLAFEQAKRIRRPGKNPLKWDPADFELRKEKRIAEIAKKYEKGKWEWKITAPDHIIAYLKARGVKFTVLTKTGKVSTQKDIMQGLSHIVEVRALLEYKENAKLLSTFCARMFTREKNGKPRYGYADENDRVHATWSVNKITGRWSARRPSWMNFPKDDKRTGRPNLRKQVRAPARLGRKLVGFDFAQLEARIIALLSNDPFLVGIFRDGKDIHTEFARIIFPGFDNYPPDVRKKLRDQTKRLEFGGFYGGTAEGLWAKVVKDVPELKVEQVALALKFMADAMPGVTEWHRELIRQVAHPPFEIRSAIYGRRRCYPLGNADINEVYNFPVQSTGADIMNTGMMNVMPRLERFHDAFPILQIHDAAVFECDEAEAEDVKKVIVDAFTQTHTHKAATVHFPVEADIGDSWAEV